MAASLEIEHERCVIRWPLVSPGLPVDPHTIDSPGDVGRTQGEIDSQPSVLVELAGSIVPPGELVAVGMVIACDVDQPEFDEVADAGTVLHLTRYDSTQGRFPLPLQGDGQLLRVDGDDITLLTVRKVR